MDPDLLQSAVGNENATHQMARLLAARQEEPREITDL